MTSKVRRGTASFGAMKFALVSSGVLLLCTTIAGVANAYTCNGAIEASAITITGVGNSITSCEMQGTVTVAVDATVTIMTTTFKGTSQLVINAGATVLLTGGNFATTGNTANPSIDVVGFDANSNIEISGASFEDDGLITLPASMTMAETSALKIMNNILTYTNRGGAGTVLRFISFPGMLTLDAGSELVVTGNFITNPLGGPTNFAAEGGILLLFISDLEPISTTGGGIIVSSNTGFPFLVEIEKGTFTTTGAGYLSITDNTQESTDALKGQGNAIEVFKASTTPVPPNFVVFIDRNSFLITLPTLDSALVGGQALWVFNMEVGKGLQGRVYIRHNTIDFTHADTNEFQTPFRLKLGDSIVDGMTGILDISDNIATLRTPTATGVNFISVINIYGTDNQIFVQRNVVTYVGQSRNFLFQMQYGALIGSARVLVTDNIIKGGRTDADSLLFHSGHVGAGTVGANTYLEISNNYIDAAFKKVLHIDFPDYYNLVIFSYNVVNFGASPVEVVTGTVNSQNVELCRNRFDHIYIDPSSTYFDRLVGTGVRLPCPVRTLSKTTSVSASVSVPPSTTNILSDSMSENITQSDHSITYVKPAVQTATLSSSCTEELIFVPSNESSTVGTLKGPVVTKTPTGVYVAAVAVGSVTTPVALLETASTVQMAAIFSVMACRTMDSNQAVMSYVLSPLQLSGTNAADLLGSFILLLTASSLYGVIALLVLTIVRRRGSQEGDAPALRVFRAKLFLWYPRVPLTVAVLLLPGIAFESCSLLYGVRSYGPWWERLVGSIGLTVSLAIVAYHVGAGIIVGKQRRLQLRQNDDEQHSTLEGCDSATESKYVKVTERITPQEDIEEDVTINEEVASFGNKILNDDDMSDCGEVSDRDAITIDIPRHSPTSSPKVSSAPVNVEKEEEASTSQDDEAPNALKEVTVTSLDGPRSSTWFVVFSNEAKSRVPSVLGTTLVANGRWNKHVLRSYNFVVVNCRDEVISYVCAHNCVRIVLVSIVAAVEGTTEFECNLVQGFIAALCFAHALFILVFRAYRVPILTPLQAAQSVCLGFLSCAGFIRSSSVQDVFIITMMILSLISTLLCFLVVLIEIRVNKVVTTEKELYRAPREDEGDSAR